MILFLLPWLDRSPVKSMRYKGPIFKSAVAIFVVVFLILGYLGTEPTNVWGHSVPWLGNADRATVVARICTAIYFLFFFLMPWYRGSKMEARAGEVDMVSRTLKTIRARLAVYAAWFLPLFGIGRRKDRGCKRAPINSHDIASLQNGAKLFVNYCLNCHSAGYMRYNRLRDLGLTETTNYGQPDFHRRKSRRVDADVQWTKKTRRNGLALRRRI